MRKPTVSDTAHITMRVCAPQVSDTGQNPARDVRGGSRAVSRAGAVRVPPGRQRRPSRPRDPGRDGRGRGAVARRGPGKRVTLRARARAAGGDPSELAALVGVEPAQVAITASTTDGCNIVLAGLDLGPDDEVVTTTDEHFGLIGPSTPPARASSCPRRTRPHRRLGHASYPAPRALARPLDDRAGAAGARAQGADRAPDPRRRRPVRRDDPGRRARARLLHDLGSEVALRARRHRRPRRRRARRSSRAGPATSPSRATSPTALSSRSRGQHASSRT